MTFIIRGKKITNSTKTPNSRSVYRQYGLSKRVDFPRLSAFYNKQDIEPEQTYIVKGLHIIVPVDVKDEVVEFIEAAILSNSFNSSVFKNEVVDNWVGVVITKAWTIVFKHNEPTGRLYPKGYNLMVKEKALPEGELYYTVEMPDLFRDTDYNLLYKTF